MNSTYTVQIVAFQDSWCKYAETDLREAAREIAEMLQAKGVRVRVLEQSNLVVAAVDSETYPEGFKTTAGMAAVFQRDRAMREHIERSQAEIFAALRQP